MGRGQSHMAPSGSIRAGRKSPHQFDLDMSQLTDLCHDGSGGYQVIWDTPPVTEIQAAAKRAGVPLDKLFVGGLEEGGLLLQLDYSLTNFTAEEFNAQW